MVETTINGGGQLKAFYRRHGEEMSFEVVSADAMDIRERARNSARERPSPRPQRREQSDTFEVGSVRSYDPERIADRFVEAGPDAEAIIKAITAVLQEIGMGHLLKTVAAKLDERGQHSLATAVRAASR